MLVVLFGLTTRDRRRTETKVKGKKGDRAGARRAKAKRFLIPYRLLKKFCSRSYMPVAMTPMLAK